MKTIKNILAMFVMIVYGIFSLQTIYANGNNLEEFSLIGFSGIYEPISKVYIDSNNLKNFTGKEYELKVDYGVEYIYAYAKPENLNDIVEIYLDDTKYLIYDKDVINNKIEIYDNCKIKAVVFDRYDNNQKKEYDIIIKKLDLPENNSIAIIDYQEFRDKTDDDSNKTRKYINSDETTIIVGKSANIILIDLYILDWVEDVKIKYNGREENYNAMEYGYYLKMDNEGSNIFEIELLGENGEIKIYKLNFINATKEIEFRIGDINYYIDGKSFVNDVTPIILEGRCIIPIRVVAESLGANVEWLSDSKEVVLKKDGKEICIKVDEPLENDMGVVKIINNRVYIPIRYVAEALGASVTYDEQSKIIKIYE